MYELFLFTYFNWLIDFGQTGVFVVVVSLMVVCTIVCIILAIFKVGYSLKKRRWVYFCYASLVAFERWVETLVVESVGFSFLSVSIAFALCAVVVAIPEPTVKIRKEQLQLAKLLDNQLKQGFNGVEDNKEMSSSQDIIKKVKEMNGDISTIKTQIMQEKSADDDQEINFSNVKTILNKLQYYSISSQDKQIARELENAIHLAEINGIDHTLKQKINDGLGALLKIMSKYAI